MISSRSTTAIKPPLPPDLAGPTGTATGGAAGIGIGTTGIGTELGVLGMVLARLCGTCCGNPETGIDETGIDETGPERGGIDDGRSR